MTLILPATYGQTIAKPVLHLPRANSGKPDFWDIGPTRVAPEWRGLWQGLRSIHPMWPQGRYAYDVIERRLSGAMPASWPGYVVGERGRCLRSSSVQYEELIFGGAGISCPFTVVAVIDNADVTTNQTNTILACSNTGGSVGWDFRVENWPATNKVSVWKGGFTGGNGGWNTGFDSPTGFAVMGLSLTEENSWQPIVWLNGEKEVSSTMASTAEPDLSGNPFSLGENEGGAPGWDVYAVYAWNRVLSDAEMRQITADPFGLIRPVAVPQRVPVLEPKRRFFSVPAQIAESKRTAKPLIFYPQVHPDWREGLCAATFGIGGDVVDVWRGPATKTTAPLDLATAGFGRLPYFSGPSEVGGTEEEVEWPWDAQLEPTTTECTVAALWQYAVADNDAADGAAIFGRKPASEYEFGIINKVFNSYRETAFFLNISGTVRYSDWEGITPAVVAGVPLLLVGRWKTGDYMTLDIFRYDTRAWGWGPLASGATYSGTTSWSSTKSGLTVGQNPLDATNFVAGAFGAGYFWSRYISDAEMDTLAADPYAPFRMADPLRIAIPYDFVVTEEAPAGVTLDQEGYRWRLDDNDEATATWLAAQDINITRQKSLNTRIRIIVNATGDPDSETYQIEYREKDSGDPWRKIE